MNTSTSGKADSGEIRPGNIKKVAVIGAGLMAWGTLNLIASS